MANVGTLPMEDRKVTLREVADFADNLGPFADNLREQILAPRRGSLHLYIRSVNWLSCAALPANRFNT